jgi:hypothetical protein
MVMEIMHIYILELGIPILTTTKICNLDSYICLLLDIYVQWNGVH